MSQALPDKKGGPPRPQPAGGAQTTDQAFEQRVLSIIQQTCIERTSGPLPPPDNFGKYDAVCPGSANRILAMAEKEQEHRHHCESAVVSIQNTDIPAGRRERRRGQILGFIVCIVSILVGGYIIGSNPALGAQVGGTILSVSALGGIIVALMTGKRTNGETMPSPVTPPSPPQPPA